MVYETLRVNNEEHLVFAGTVYYAYQILSKTKYLMLSAGSVHNGHKMGRTRTLNEKMIAEATTFINAQSPSIKATISELRGYDTMPHIPELIGDLETTLTQLEKIAGQK